MVGYLIQITKVYKKTITLLGKLLVGYTPFLSYLVFTSGSI